MRKKLLATLCAAGLLSHAAAAHADPQSCQSVRMADIGWTDNTVQNAVFSNLLTALGYTPKTTLFAEEVAYAGLANGQLDVFLDDWTPSMDSVTDPYEKAGKIDKLGPDLTGAKYTLVVPSYLYKKGLKSFADIAKFGPQLKYSIYGIEPGNDGNQHILDMIKQNKFGLGKFHLVQSSEAGMLAQVARVYPKKGAVVFLGWEPEPMNVTYSLEYLPGGDAFFGPNYGAATIYINTRSGYAAQCPNVGKMLKNFSLPIDAENAMMNDIQTNNMQGAVVAKNWLKAHPAWVSAELSGVTTLSGQPALPVVTAELAN